MSLRRRVRAHPRRTASGRVAVRSHSRAVNNRSGATVDPRMAETTAAAPTDATTDQPRKREFQVFLARMPDVRERIAAINKRAAKKGLPPVVCVWGKPYTKTLTVWPASDPHQLGKPRTVKEERVPLTIEGEPPKYAGWTFVATLEHLGSENIVRAVPGQALPRAYRNRGPVCDHCKVARRRADTYVVRHDDGRLVQVGRTCLKDFMGSHAAENIAASASFLAMIGDLAEEGELEGSWGGRAPHLITLVAFLELVAWFVRTHGWLSRSVYRKQMDEGKSPNGRPTADLAWACVWNPKTRQEYKPDPSADDAALAAAAADWAETLSDAEVDAETGDYLHNLRAVARTGMVGDRTTGIAASLTTAYQRKMGTLATKARAARPVDLDAYVGAVGDKVRLVVTLEFVTGWQGDYGYTTLLKFRTAEGAVVTWKASGVATSIEARIRSDAAHETAESLSAVDYGKTFTVFGTVKKLEEYKGTKQTQLTRCTVREGDWHEPAKVKKAAKPRTPKMPKPTTTKTEQLLTGVSSDVRIYAIRSLAKGATVTLHNYDAPNHLLGKVAYADFEKAVALGEVAFEFTGNSYLDDKVLYAGRGRYLRHTTAGAPVSPTLMGAVAGEPVQ